MRQEHSVPSVAHQTTIPIAIMVLEPSVQEDTSQAAPKTNEESTPQPPSPPCEQRI